ncbi:MAG: hypothetical protein ACR2JE_11680 [Acidobacteriaceae bacterium]
MALTQRVASRTFPTFPAACYPRPRDAMRHATYITIMPGHRSTPRSLRLSAPRRYMRVLPARTRPNLFSGD